MTPRNKRYKPQHTVRSIRGAEMAMVRQWQAARGLPATNSGIVSDLGFICDDRVAGWLYITNGNMALIEGIVSNPNTIPSLRKASLKYLCYYLVDLANELGYTNIVGITMHPSIKKICQDLGFKTNPAFEVWALSEKK